MNGIERIARERQRQIAVEAWTPEHDAAHKDELALAAFCYLTEHQALGGLHSDPEQPPDAWPWDEASWKPAANPIRNLEKAGALIAAEIDRLLAVRFVETAVGPEQP